MNKGIILKGRTSNFMNEKFSIPMSKPNFGKEEEEGILSVMQTTWPSQGKVTEEFEFKLADYLSSNVVVVNNGSSALMSALLAHGFKPGDKVLVPDFTFVATSSIPKILGARVIVADIDQETLNISPQIVEKIVRNNDIKFVIVVDVGGLPVDIDALSELSVRYGFVLIEDAAQAFGSEFKNKKLGGFDHTTIFSFQITKQLTTVEGGCVATTNQSIIDKIRKIKDYGRSGSELYVHDTVGTNFRTTDIQSAIGIEQLKKINEHIKTRNKIANIYKKNIKNVQFQKISNFVSKHSFMIFFSVAENQKLRDEYVFKLNQNGIDARKSWMPIHMQPCNSELHNSVCNSAEEVYKSSFTLPIFNAMTEEEAEEVVMRFNQITEKL